MPRGKFYPAAAPLQTVDDSEDEELRQVLEMSLMDAGGSAGCSSQTEDEEDDFNRAIELSLISHPEVKKTFDKDGSGTTVKDEQLVNAKLGNDDSIVVTYEVPRNDTIEISDEHDSMYSANNSTKSPVDRLTNPQANNSTIVLSDTTPPENDIKKVKVDLTLSKPSIVIESDESPPVKLVVKKKVKKVLKSSAPVPGQLEKKPFLPKQRLGSAVVLQSQVGTAGASSRHFSSRFDTESDEEDEKDMKADEKILKHKVKKAVKEDPPPQTPLSTEEVTARMRNVFESGLAIHFSGEEMEACTAVSTSLFPHQRVALAWMFRHENKEADGMRGGILADDMGLGKTLTVISLIMTNHWDSKPLAKPELGYTRPPLNTGQRGGKGKVGGAFKSKVSAEAVGVGSKLGKGVAVKKTTIGGMFDKFIDDDSEKENKSKFKFGKQKKVKTEVFKKRFIDDSSSSNSDNDEDMDRSEDEFDNKWSKTDRFAKDLPLKEVKSVEHNDHLCQEERMFSTRQAAFDSKLNVDGFVDGSSSDEELDKLETGRRLAANKVMKKRKLSTEEMKEKPTQEKKIKTVKPFSSSDEEFDVSLPDVSLESSTPSYKQKSSKFLEDSAEAVETENTHVSSDSGLKLIIPPKMPADRGDRRRPTLLVCPASLIGHWVEQLQQHLDKSVSIRLKVHHGASKSQTGTDLESFDIVVTTYGTLAAEWGGGQVTPLTKARWLRVVMDEGHNIKNHNSKCAKAALGLDTVRRWIVTGTPIQNNLMELWSLVNWLNFGMYCGKAQMKVFKQQIEGPCKKGDQRGFERLQVLMDTICLRRTKTDRKPDGSPLVVLPSKTIVTREVEMTEEERMCYAIYHKRAQEIVGRYHKKGQLLRNYAHVFALMMRLRQLCCHREVIKDVDWGEVLKDKEGLAKQLEDYLDEDEVIKRRTETDGADTGLEEDLERRLVSQLREMIRSGVSDDCSVCLDDLKTPVITPCAHVFCRTCIERVLDTMKPPSCPLCRNKIDNKKHLLEAGQDEDGEEKGESTLSDMEDIQVDISSSKVNAVLKEMLRIQRDCPDDKIVVVSQFTSFLSILQPLIKQNNFSMVRLDGTMSHFDRSETVSVFQSTKKNSPNVMLLSLKAGGVGLNLTAANHLLLLDPAWNPASEWQCFDRTHRLGQKKEVTIYKYITKDSIEEKMVEIQDKKKDLISGAFHMPADERRRQRVDDIINIFGI